MNCGQQETEMNCGQQETEMNSGQQETEADVQRWPSWLHSLLGHSVGHRVKPNMAANGAGLSCLRVT